MKEYLDTIYTYYPQNVSTSDLNYINTPENLRQWSLIDSERKKNLEFDELTTVLVKHLNCSGFQDLSLRGVFDLSRKVLLYLPDNHFHEEYPYCIVSVSIIARYYCVYFTKFTGTPINTLRSGYANSTQKLLVDNIISRIIKTYYNGYEPFPLAYMDEPVPNVYSSKNYDKNATFFECLITDDVL